MRRDEEEGFRRRASSEPALMLLVVWLLSAGVAQANVIEPLIDSRGFLRDVLPVLDYSGGGAGGDVENGQRSLDSPPVAKIRCFMRGRQVPGDGACLFHALSAGLWLSMNGTHHPMSSRPLREQSMLLRQVAIDVLEDGRDPWLYMGDAERLRASKLLTLAAEQCGQSPRDYAHKLRKPHSWGGGPEIVALSNAMRRPIHVYELLWAIPSSSSYTGKTPRWCLKCIAEFGSPRFDRKCPPLHILSCDSRFPNLSPEQMLDQGNHFLLLFDCDAAEAVDAAKEAGLSDQEASDQFRVGAVRREEKKRQYRDRLKTTVIDFDEYFRVRPLRAFYSIYQKASLVVVPFFLLAAIKTTTSANSSSSKDPLKQENGEKRRLRVSSSTSSTSSNSGALRVPAFLANGHNSRRLGFVFNKRRHYLAPAAF